MTQTTFQDFTSGSPNVGVIIDLVQEGNTITITNNSETSATITGIWFDGGEFSLSVGSGVVNFVQVPSQALPGGNNIGWNAEDDVIFLPVPPPTKNGVNPGESLSFVAQGAPYTGRVALHVQSIGETAYSAGYEATVVPEPAAPLALLAAIPVALLRRKRR